MDEAWEMIKNIKVTVTIDTFQWGSFSLNYEQPKRTFYNPSLKQ
jgi:hypothetical protein